MIDLAAIEGAVRDGAPARVPMLLRALEALEAGDAFAGVGAPAEGFARMAQLLAAVLTDRQAEIAPADRQRLQLYGSIVANVFAASETVDPAAALAALWPDGPPTDDIDALERGLVLLGPDTAVEIGIDAVLDMPAPRALMTALNLVGAKPVLTAGGEARRDLVLANAENLRQLDLPGTLTALSVLTNAWMNCSYSSQPGKHAIKSALNAVLRRLQTRIRPTGLPPPPPRKLKDRPKMVVVAEVMHEGHVQYRYFGQYLRQLRTRFELVLVAPKSQVSPAVPALFDEVFAFDNTATTFLNEVSTFISEAQPDIVFWPSVGMARWGPLMANLRFAPIQMTALGHSASTFSPAIDYYLTEEGYVGDPALFSETLLLLPDDSLRFEAPPGWTPPAARPRDGQGPVRIAIPSNLLKLNPTFLATLGRVRRAAATPVEFHIFPNAAPFEVAALRTAARAVLETAIVYPRLPAPAYLDALNACDLVLSPFPFGGLHSVVDALRLGLPVVAMEGLEPHSRTDAMILRRVGMPERLIAHDEDAYVATAVELIDNPETRLDLGRLALASDVTGKMFAGPGDPLRSEVVDAVWAVYQRHGKMMVAGRKAWTLADLKALD